MVCKTSYPFVVVTERTEHLYQCGALFDRQDLAMTLWTASWPDGLDVRDTVDDLRYRVRSYTTRRGIEVFEHQRLESLSGFVWLVPTYNGNLRRLYPPARYVISDKSVYTHTVYHVTRDGVRALCGWQFNGAAVLPSPPEGLRECRNCYSSPWRLVP